MYWGARSGKNLSEPVPGAMQTNNRGELLVRSASNALSAVRWTLTSAVLHRPQGHLESARDCSRTQRTSGDQDRLSSASSSFGWLFDFDTDVDFPP